MTLVLDELGYLPIDKHGADLLFQVISHRYERGAIIISTNRAFKQWPEIFNNDATLTSAILDRLLHHAETVVIEGKSFRMKDVIESWKPFILWTGRKTPGFKLINLITVIRYSDKPCVSVVKMRGGRRTGAGRKKKPARLRLSLTNIRLPQWMIFTDQK